MAKIIMVQGTSSGVGKSILTTALCRIFIQDGFKVAPFKSQNMSSNFHLLPNGDKMARSQALAAYACNVEPSVDMNPILLMPMELQKTEVIVGGKSWGYMDNLNYTDFKQKAFDEAIAAYNRLAEQNEIVVIEGAGSPVELNLNKNDIVNMGLAERISCPVILVSDIIRGGVFASLYGTMSLLSDNQRALVKGLVINKFKGFVEHFGDGRKILEQLCNVPVVGVVPYMDIQLEDEDSLVDLGRKIKTKQSLAGEIDDVSYYGFMEKEFDKLAMHFRNSLDMAKIYNFISEV